MYLWKTRLKTVTLLALLTALLLFVGGALGGRGGLVAAILFAAAMNFGAYLCSDRIVLRMYGAHEVTEREASPRVRMVRELAWRAGLPMPRGYIHPR